MADYSAATLGAFASAAATAAAGGTLRLRASATTIVDIPLEATAFDVSGAILTARGADGATAIGAENALEGTTAAAGTIDNYQVLNSSAGIVWSQATLTGISLDTTVIAGSGRTVRAVSWTHTVGNAA